MSVVRLAASALLLAASAAGLSACADATRGVPPSPANLDYPNVNRVSSDRQRPLKSEAEQQQLRSDLAAGKPPPGARRTGRR